MSPLNAFDQPIGFRLPDWTPPAPPAHTAMSGRYCRLEPADVRFVLGDDLLFYVIVEVALGRAVGQASYLNIKPSQGSIEVGHVYFSPLAQRTRVATEAMYLMMRRAFETGYRRYEWKCDALNAPSRAAAARSRVLVRRRSSGRRRWSRGATATRRGTRRSTASGRRWPRRSRRG